MLKDFLSTVDQYGVKNYNPIILLLASFVFMVIFSIINGYLLLHFELEHGNNNVKTIADSIWLMFTTLTTIGYGDFYPVSAYGRLCIIVQAVVCGLILMSFFSAIIISITLGMFDKSVENREIRTMLSEVMRKLNKLENNLDLNDTEINVDTHLIDHVKEQCTVNGHILTLGIDDSGFYIVGHSYMKVIEEADGFIVLQETKIPINRWYTRKNYLEAWELYQHLQSTL